jgi:hypothetical protein
LLDARWNFGFWKPRIIRWCRVWLQCRRFLWEFSALGCCPELQLSLPVYARKKGSLHFQTWQSSHTKFSRPLLRQGRSTFSPSSRETTICQWIQTALPFTRRRKFFKLSFWGSQRAHQIRERLKALPNFICRLGCCLLVGLRVRLWPPSTCRSCPQSHCLESLSLYCSFQF